ncbi:Nedd4 e3 ubiquitin-protein ligase wwp1 [Globisporangium polare]
MSSAAYIVGAIILCILFWLIAAAAIVKAGKWSNRMALELELHAPLLSTEHRLDAALREVEEGFNRCDVCDFANFKRFRFCNVCGEEIHDEEFEKQREVESDKGARKTIRRLWKSTKRGSVEILSRTSQPPRLTRSQRSRRQRRARNRKEWTRMLNGEDKLVWSRDVSGKTELRFPGYVVQFYGETPTVEPEHENTIATTSSNSSSGDDELDTIVVVVESAPEPENTSQPDHAVSSEEDGTTPPVERTEQPDDEAQQRQPLLTKAERVVDLQSAIAGMSMELLESTVANPANLSIVAVSDTSLQWRYVTNLASQVFPPKYAHFVMTTAGVVIPAERQIIRLNVNRANLFEDSMESISAIPVGSVRTIMRINFVDEPGLDAGGLQREWFVLLNEQLVNPSCGVFLCVNKEDQIFYLNPNSSHDIGENHLMYYFAAGRLVGRALLEGQVLGFHLALPLIKIVLGIPVTFSDLEYFDPELYKNLLWIMENEDVGNLGLDFSVTEKRGDDIITVDLIPNGRSIDVTDDNKDEYLERRFRYLLFESVSSQLYVFLKGLYEVIPQELLMLFDPEEFDYLLCGSDEIDVDDWERNTKYTPNLYEQPAMKWFWELVREMPNEYRQRLLHFATGSSRVPIAGFSSLTSYDGRLCPFTLKGVNLVNDGYIWSHACFNRLDLPLHYDRAQLKAVLYAALETEMYGFTTN